MIFGQGAFFYNPKKSRETLQNVSLGYLPLRQGVGAGGGLPMFFPHPQNAKTHIGGGASCTRQFAPADRGRIGRPPKILLMPYHPSMTQCFASANFVIHSNFENKKKEEIQAL
jgi:hypothetical protein